MTHQNLTTKPINSSLMMKRILIGGGIALILIALFVFSVDNPKPEWGKYWMIRPLIITPLAGAVGGLFYHYMEHLRSQQGWIKVIGTILSLIGYIIVLWLGTVLGLDGTLWN